MKNLNHKKILVVFVSVFILVSIALYLYNNTLIKSLSGTANQTLKEVMEQQRQILCSELKNKIAIIKYASKSIEMMSNEDTERSDILSALFSAVSDSGFSEIIITDKYGNAITSSGYKGNISDREYFTHAIKGDTYISKVILSKTDGEPSIVFSTPFYYKGEIVGIVAGGYDTYDFSQLITPTFNGYGSVNVMSKDGDTILSISSEDMDYRYKGGNFFDVFEPGKVTILAGDDINTITENVRSLKQGFAKYSFGDTPRFMYYAPLGINDWVITSVIKENNIDKTTNKIMQNSLILTFFIIILFAGIILYIVYINNKNSKKLEKLAYYDELTCAPNFTKFKIELHRIINEYPNRNFMLIKLDISKFKIINDIFGRETGDKVIKEVANILKAFATVDYCTYARINADEFILLDSIDIENTDTVETINDKYNEHKLMFDEMLTERIDYIKGHKLECRFGRYILEKDDFDIDDIWEKVNLAHRIAKLQKFDEICDFKPEFKKKFVREIEIENRIDTAIFNDEFKLFIQPKYRISDEKIVGGEALVRWIVNGEHTSYPNEFIPVFEKSGSIMRLDFHMLEKTCILLASMIQEGQKPVCISVNFSRTHVLSKTFLQDLCAIVDDYGVPHELIELEITESAMLDDEKSFIKFLNSIHEMGFALAMDDFGTGYSSLGSLKNMPIDCLKLDRSFFIDAKDGERSYAVVETIAEMTKKLKIKTVAEGVEEKEQVDMLKKLGYDVVQGYYYSKPIPKDEFVILLTNSEKN